MVAKRRELAQLTGALRPPRHPGSIGRAGMIAAHLGKRGFPLDGRYWSLSCSEFVQQVVAQLPWNHKSQCKGVWEFLTMRMLWRAASDQGVGEINLPGLSRIQGRMRGS
jgi:hypothetical protein